jgi:Cof subfamily protein (haloacid dehalogenase superfamily)
MSEIKLISLDVDGTLLTSEGRLPEQNKTAILAAIKKGVRVVLTTGRPAPAIKEYIKELGLRDVIITMGGALIHDISDPEEWKIIHAEYLPADILPRIAPLVRDLPLTIQILVAEDTYFYHGKADGDYLRYFANYQKTHNFSGWEELPRSPLEDYSAGSSRIIKIVFHSNEDEPVDEAFRRIKRVEDKIIMVGYSAPRTIDISPRSSGKREGVEYLCGLYDIKPEEVLALGDYETDLALINWAGVGAVMRNAPDFVLAQAPRVAPENDQAGVAQMIDQFVLKDLPLDKD